MGKKKGSDHFRDILNPYGEKPNYGKIGRRRRLSKLNVFFFHNSVGCHNSMVIFHCYVKVHQRVELDCGFLGAVAVTNLFPHGPNGSIFKHRKYMET